MNTLHIKNLDKSFEHVNVLNQLTYTFEKGKIYTILGKNGSGKTTLFNCIAGFLEIDDGEILDDHRQKIHPSDIGMIHTESYLPNFLTAYEFLAFFIDMHKNLDLDRKNLDAYLDSIQLTQEDRHRLIKDYSSGMKHKLQMLIVLLSKPKVLLLDEPLTSFDLIASYEMKKLLISLKSETIMIVSTHILQIAKDLSDEILILNQGHLTPMDDIQAENLEERVMEILYE